MIFRTVSQLIGKAVYYLKGKVLMENMSVVHQFILFRSHGQSLGRIAAELGVSKATLSGWDNKYGPEISQLKADAFQTLRDESKALEREKLAGVIVGLKRLYDLGKIYPELVGTVENLFKLSDETIEAPDAIPDKWRHIL